ncbi:MAG: arginine--tRNA ligase [Eubacteriales bacterium]
MRTGAKDLIHVPFGMVSVMGSKMSTREGNMLLLEDILNTSVDKVRALIEQKNPALENKDEVAEMVGLGAIIFNDLSNNRIRDIDFNWDEALNFEGNTGPYVQYTYARTCSVLSKADASETPSSIISHEAERALSVVLALYPERIAQAARELEPSVISRYLLDVCAVFNRFYHDCPILKAEGDVRTLRLSLTAATGRVLQSGLELIGIACPKAI